MNWFHRACCAAVLLFAACASEAPNTAFDASAGIVVITVCGDGFVRSGDRRVPLEAIVLELRQRTRTMEKDAVLRFVVQLLAEPLPPGSPAAARASGDIDRLFRELHVMGVKQVRLL